MMKKIKCPFCSTKIEVDFLGTDKEQLIEDKPEMVIKVKFVGNPAGYSKWFALAKLKELKDILEPTIGKVSIEWSGEEVRNNKYGESGTIGEAGSGEVEGDGTQIRYSLT